MFHLWKDHTAVAEAVEISKAFSDYNGTDYTRYQGTYSSEWYWAKILHTSRTDRDVREAAWSWVEHCDWITGLLTGNLVPEKDVPVFMRCGPQGFVAQRMGWIAVG